MADYSREALIAICERATVPQERWRNRDTSGAQRQMGEALVLLRAGCDFRVLVGDEGPTKTYNRHLITNERVIWVEITFKGFDHFEQGGHLDDETFYLPTAAVLDAVDGGDWY